MGAEGNGEDEVRAPQEPDYIVLPPAASDSWRTWLKTGARRAPFDRRRLRGANKGLKKMLIEGRPAPDDRPQPWNDFTNALVRLSIDEAMNELPSDQKQAVKLAYFGGLTNREIAEQLGVGEGAVRRRLRLALAAIGTHIERGLAAGRSATYAVGVWLTGRWFVDLLRRIHVPASEQVAQGVVVLAAGVVAVSVLAGHPPSPAQLARVDGSTGGAVTAPSTGTPNVPGTNSLPVPVPAPPALPTSLPAGVKVPAVPLPVTLPTPTPILPTPPILPGI
jgi:RNA polymerase sigma factor (sigma-70 family)